MACPNFVVSALDNVNKAIDYLTDPIASSPGLNRKTLGVLCLHVDDLFLTGNKKFVDIVIAGLRREFQIGSQDQNNVEFVGQRTRWICNDPEAGRPYVSVDQH